MCNNFITIILYAYVKLHIYLIFVPLHVRGFSFPPRKVYPLCVYFTLLTVILTPNYNILPHICRLLPPIDSFYILKIKGTKIYDILSTVWGGDFFKGGLTFTTVLGWCGALNIYLI